MEIVERRHQKEFSLHARELDISKLGSLSSKLAKRVVMSIADSEKYPKLIAKELKENEQKIYYHIHNLERAGIISPVREQMVNGAMARFYKVSEPALVLRFQDLVPAKSISLKDKKVADFLQPFIIDGQLKAKIVVGSPDPHGPDNARSRDGYYGMDLALFLGTFLDYVPNINVRLDTEMREEELQENLILIGGPIVNTVTAKFNNHLPIFFSPDKNIYSKLSKTSYSSDETGLIVKVKNPFNKEASILVVGGKRFSGTRAAIMAFLKGFGEILDGNRFRKGTYAKVVEGLDMDSDGVVDSVEFRE